MKVLNFKLEYTRCLIPEIDTKNHREVIRNNKEEEDRLKLLRNLVATKVKREQPEGLSKTENKLSFAPKSSKRRRLNRVKKHR